MTVNNWTMSAGSPAGSLPAGSLSPQLGARLPATSSHALDAWHAHQPDRAWIEWGVCWPPISVRRPRCMTCLGTPWPCQPALAAARCLVWSGRAGDVRVHLPSRVNASRRGGRRRANQGPCPMNTYGYDVHPGGSVVATTGRGRARSGWRRW